MAGIDPNRPFKVAGANVGYRIAKRSFDCPARRMTELREEVLHPLIDEHRGRIVKLMGEGLPVAQVTGTQE